MHFTEQREKLMGRKEEVDRAHHAIVDLMDHLERKKDEAIQFTFRQVGVGMGGGDGCEVGTGW